MEKRKNLRVSIDGQRIDEVDEKGESSDIIQELMLLSYTMIPKYIERVDKNFKSYEKWYQEQ